MVMGAGAVGSYYGALLARAGHDVTLIARGEHLTELERAGRVTVREPDGNTWSAPVRAFPRPGPPAPDLVIVTVKSHHTVDAATGLRDCVAASTAVLSLQNGVENVARLNEVLGRDDVLGGQAFVGLRITTPGVVDHQAEGRVGFGDPRAPDGDLARRVAGIVGSAWKVTLSDDITHDLWNKLLWNIGFNAMCAVTGATSGETLAVPESEALVRGAMQELVRVAARNGVTLTREAVDGMAAFNPQLRDYRPSTAQDIAAGKPVERDAICGFVVREADRLGTDAPVNRVLDGLLALQEARATGAIAAALARLDRLDAAPGGPDADPAG